MCVVCVCVRERKKHLFVSTYRAIMFFQCLFIHYLQDLKGFVSSTFLIDVRKIPLQRSYNY